MASQDVKLSVLVITYNQERYIAQALESALMQQTLDEYEVVVGEDCSTDRTRGVLLEYRERHPDKIRLLLHEKNVGMNRNFAQTLSACRGRYIAILEGDDYWISPKKLQRQVDFLDAHPECTACFHNVRVVYEGGEKPDHLFHTAKIKPFLTLRDVASTHFIPTCSTVFRSGLFGKFPEWFYSMPMGDWPLHVLNAEHGLFGYIDEIMSCYRVHAGGIWSGERRVEVLKKSIYAAETINRHLKYKYDPVLKNLITKWKFEICLLLYEDEDYQGAAEQLRDYFRNAPFLGRDYRKGLRQVLKWKIGVR